MALDSIFANAAIPPPSKSNTAGSNGSDSSSGVGSSNATAGNANAGTAARSGADSSRTAGSSKHTPDSSSGSNANNTSSGSRATSGSSSGGSSASAKSSSAANARSKQGGPQSRSAANSTATSAAANGSTAAKSVQGGANAQQGGLTGLASNSPPSFLEALAQSQADAAQSGVATALSADTAAPGAKTKSAGNNATDAPSPASLAFISQSWAAAIGGGQQPAGAQAANNVATTDSDDADNSTDAVSLTSGPSTIQSLVSNLAKDAADTAKASTTDTTGVGAASQTDTPASSAPAADGSSAAVSAFQAHMSVGSHFQTPDTHANQISSPVGSPAFNDEVGGKVTWLATQGIQSASIQLSPEHLGPVNVHISLQDGSASVSFTAAHADTRAALEQALPRLREMFATQGLTLSDANVSQQSPREQAQKQSVSAIGSSGGVSDDATSSTVTSVVGNRLGLVDTYA